MPRAWLTPVFSGSDWAKEGAAAAIARSAAEVNRMFFMKFSGERVRSAA
jgi:hypothetical protein